MSVCYGADRRPDPVPIHSVRTQGAPLALFLDDLQCLDAATLDLLEHLVTHPEVRHLMLVGAHRDKEVGLEHPLLRTLEAIRAVERGCMRSCCRPRFRKVAVLRALGLSEPK